MSWRSSVIILCLVFSTKIFAQGALPPIVAPKDNPQTPQKIELGKQLFFDPRVSSSGTLSCQSCHNVMSGGDDNRASSVGVKAQLGGRSSPTVWNSAYQSVLFWDGRAASLEEQAKGPLVNPVEMGMKDHNAVMTVIAKIPGYQRSFKEVFGGENPVTIDNFAKAVAAYERTLVTPNSAYDRCTAGEKKFCTPAAERGLKLAMDTGCMACHNGPNFSGPMLPPGTGLYQKFPTFTDNAYAKKYDFLKDKGRHQVTNKKEDLNMWRVPTLRNVALTAPYFHNGKVRTLPEAVKIMAKVQLNKDLNDKQVADIVAFLESLTGEFPVQTMPRLPETLSSTVINEHLY